MSETETEGMFGELGDMLDAGGEEFGGSGGPDFGGDFVDESGADFGGPDGSEVDGGPLGEDNPDLGIGDFDSGMYDVPIDQM